MRLSKPQFWRIVFGLLTLALVSLTAHRQAFGASESVLWDFGNSNVDGFGPFAGLIMDTSGNLYGTTAYGGAFDVAYLPPGTVFKLTPPSTIGGSWTASIIWNFGNGTDGRYPDAGLIIDTGGNLYGTTSGGGAYGYGTVFKLMPPSTSGGNWTESILWNFQNNGIDGIDPAAGLIMDTGGNLYGTTAQGGAYYNGEVLGGTVFKLTPPSTIGGSWTESILWNFGNGTDGFGPVAGLIMDTSGNLYGTTADGGAYGFYNNNGSYVGGTVFKLTPPSTIGGNWTESILWSFGNGTDGSGPVAGLLMDTSGNLYGTTEGGGNGYGTVFKLTPQSMSGGSWTESILWSFLYDVTINNGGDGRVPLGGLIMDGSGNLYGTTELGGAYGILSYNGGTVFELTPPSTAGGNWTESILWDFDDTDGAEPYAGLIMDTGGNLYGTTFAGGNSPCPSSYQGCGTVFEISNIGATPTPAPTPTATPTPTTVLTASPAKLKFGNIDATTSSKTKKLTLDNKGLVPAQIGVLSPPASFIIASDTCSSATLQPKKKCTVEVRFAPATVVGSVSEAFVIPYNGTSPSVTLEGDGTAVTLTAPASTRLPGAIAGSIGKAKKITINNESGATVQMGAPGAIPDFMITTDGCANVSLAPEAKCVVTVEFAPAGGSSGELTSTLGYSFTYGANSGNVAVTLKGKVK